MKTLLAIAAVLGLCLAGASPAAAEDKASLRLNWILYGFHTPFYLGVERGYFKDEGIDLTIGEGQGSIRGVQIVGSKSDTFGLSDGSSVIAGVVKGAPVKAVMAVSNLSPYAISMRADLGIKTIKDLEGHTIAGTPGEAGYQLFAAVLKASKLDPAKVRLLNLDGPGKMVAVAEKRADGLLSGLDNQALVLPHQGVPLISFGYPEMGVNTIGLTLHAHRDTIAQNPDLVRRFVKAAARSFEAAQADPDASIKAGLKVKPDMDPALAMEQLKVGFSLMKSPNSKDLPTGASSPKDWADTLELMKTYQDLQTTEPAESFYTNDFVPKKSS